MVERTGRLILLVDDDADLRRFVARPLVTERFEVHEADDPVEGFECAVALHADRLVPNN
jgi:DNA-binding response OmpR family regulator